ncbi:MAG: RyR domain-containing protein [Cyanobacteria bacterium P01_F01_bin.150]
MSYTPQPINIADITLTAQQQALAELIVQNVHAHWSKNQLQKGWNYGVAYDQATQVHPELVPYSQLAERSQQEKRAAVHTVLKILLALGGQIEMTPNSAAQKAAHVDTPDITFILDALKSSSNLNVATLLTLQRETIKLKPRTPSVYHALGESILQLGEPLMAYDLLAEGLKHWPADLRLQQLLALALARSGATIAANALLENLVRKGHADEETIGLLARTHKDLWSEAAVSAARSSSNPSKSNYSGHQRLNQSRTTLYEQSQTHLKLAAQRYQQAYDLTGSIWTGINAATMACLMNQTDRAHALARTIREGCLEQLQQLNQSSGDPYWLLATLGEAALILGEWSEAEDFYSRAVESGQGRFGDFSSSRRNALLLGHHLNIDAERIKKWFHIPKVVVFCGHRIDSPDRPHPRFPPHLEAKVYETICDRLQKLDANLGYASAACGSDILFLEAIQALKGELHIVLPYEREEFIKDSVRIPNDDNQWEKRFNQVINAATEVIVTSKRKLRTSAVMYEYSNRLLHGLAKIRAEQLGTELVPLTVWNGQPGDGLGGTASTVNYWQAWSDTVEIIDLEQLQQPNPISLQMVSSLTSTPTSTPISASAPKTVTKRSSEQTPPAALSASASGPSLPSINIKPGSSQSAEPQLRAILFADVVHYTRLMEDQFPPFAQHFLGAVADLVNTSTVQPLMKNTWGDAIYLVFTTVQQAGHIALDLCDLVHTADWGSKGLPEDLNLRIALHAGPVSCQIDPITQQVNYVGTHVNHTARIEPITPPGKVYASQAFAAIASSEGHTTFNCDYVGQMPWAKHYGTFPTYHVRRVRYT